MTQDYDVVIIGSGPGGNGAAYALAAEHKSVAVVENDLFGGTCPNRGCDPKRILLAAIEAKAYQDHMLGKGIDGGSQVNWPDLMAHKRNYTDAVPEKTEAGLKAAGVTTYHGSGKFTDEGTFEIGSEELSARNFIIATGQHPALLPMAGQENLLTSNDFLNLNQMPRDITIIGGGYIGFELSSIAKGAGANVHLIHHNNRPLKQFDEELVTDFVAAVKDEGIDVQLNTNVTEVQKADQQFNVQTADGRQFKTDAVFCAAGRVPNVDQLNLAAVGITTDRHGIQVDEHLKTTNPKIYAVGDVVSESHPKLTPKAAFDAAYVAADILNPSQSAIDYPAIPTVVYGQPKLATVGVSEKDVQSNPDAYEVKSQDVTSWLTYHRIHDPYARVKTIIQKSTHQVIGAQVMSSEADSLINAFTLMIDEKIDQKRLNQLILAYPTTASDLTYFN
ncbi:dihydrolipoyl dehydrogenase family protein [Levilactobacillus bambusae]|uniref:NAD(P)/FAD-dependent oxidoreductase n=1 Tax=Levilactobacillus bambusae TaxID=2024736 RepID=A0A2V1MW30_9LACO|nr:NAD(P)/FAD-dependent oxidoreductase [Levilactobacillus bambusae]PWF99343.1 NAD(P)/FAD-dependent oxidoreductase [Levilactobacillus bambusae]